MVAIAPFIANDLLNNMFRAVTLAHPVNANSLYLALLKTATPASDGTPTDEVPFANGYERLHVTDGGQVLATAAWGPSVGNSGAPTNQLLVNQVEYTWPQASGDWAAGGSDLVRAVALCNHATNTGANTVVAYGVLPVPRAVTENDTIRIAEGSITLQLGPC